MATLVLDASSHQAVRELGQENTAYGLPPADAGRWAGQRLVGLRNRMQAAGHSLILAEPDRESLADADVLIVGSRSQHLPFTGAALEAIVSFVEAGGGLLLMANHRGLIAPQQQLAEALKLPLAFNDISVTNKPRVEMRPHKTTFGITGIAVRNSCSIRVSASAEILAQFEAAGHVFAAAASVGRGRVIAVADSGFMASRDDAGLDMFETADNARFLSNAIDWLLPQN